MRRSPGMNCSNRARLLVAVISLGAAALALGPAASASTMRATPAKYAVRNAAKIAVGGVWTLERTGTGCENDTFSSHHRFSAAVTDGSGDGGTDKGTKKLTMIWKSGLDRGATFKGRFQGVTGDYTGRYSLGGQTVPASLIPYVTGACLSSSSMTAHPLSTTVALGSEANDRATVYGTGSVTPTGSVTFYVCPGDAHPCTAAAATTAGNTPSTVALTGTGEAAEARSPAYTAPTLGPYCYLAIYSGDDHYAVASDGATVDQCFTVVNGDQITTTPSTTSFPLGGTVSDGATVTGDADTLMTGTVTFYVCGPATSETPCTQADRTALGAPVTVSTAGALNLVTAASVPYTPPGVGGYCFVGVYSGDANYVPGTDGSTTECFTVTPAAP
jgi:hypothetical protein